MKIYYWKASLHSTVEGVWIDAGHGFIHVPDDTSEEAVEEWATEKISDEYRIDSRQVRVEVELDTEPMEEL